jgi:hypothetical protein
MGDCGFRSDRNVGAVARRPQCYGQSDATRSSADENCLAPKQVGHVDLLNVKSEFGRLLLVDSNE